MKAGLLDSEVQENLRAGEVAGDELASGLQCQRAAQADLLNVVRPFELACCGIPLTAAGGGGIFAVPATVVAWLGREAKPKCLLQGF